MNARIEDILERDRILPVLQLEVLTATKSVWLRGRCSESQGKSDKD